MGNVILSAANCLCVSSFLVPKRILSSCQWKFFKYGMRAKCAIRMGTAGMRCAKWLEENPFSFGLALLNAFIQSLRPAEGVQAREHQFSKVMRTCQHFTVVCKA